MSEVGRQTWKVIRTTGVPLLFLASPFTFNPTPVFCTSHSSPSCTDVSSVPRTGDLSDCWTPGPSTSQPASTAERVQARTGMPAFGEEHRLLSWKVLERLCSLASSSFWRLQVNPGLWLCRSRLSLLLNLSQTPSAFLLE